jgi:acetyl esterase/lipase
MMAQNTTRSPPYTVQAYGDHPSQYVRIWAKTPTPSSLVASATIFLVHGGFWRQKYGLDTPAGTAAETLAPDIAARGCAVVEVEYRRYEPRERLGFPHANHDVVAAVRFIAKMPGQLDERGQPGRIVLVGMSAGGQLVLSAAMELEGDRALAPVLTIAIAPVADLELAFELRLGDNGDAVRNYMHGTPAERLSEYRQACCMCRSRELGEISGSVLLVTGSRDVDVPPDMVRCLHRAIVQSANSLSGRFRLVEFPDEDHYDLMRASSRAWAAVVHAMMGSISM